MAVSVLTENDHYVLRWVFMPPPPLDAAKALFSGCPSGRASGSPCVLLAHLRNQWTEFHQTWVTGVVEATDELIRFWRSSGQGQGRCKVKYLSELLWRVHGAIHSDTLGSKYHLVFFYKHTFSAVFEPIFSKFVTPSFIGNRSIAIRIFLKVPLNKIRGETPHFAKFLGHCITLLWCHSIMRKKYVKIKNSVHWWSLAVA